MENLTNGNFRSSETLIFYYNDVNFRKNLNFLKKLNTVLLTYLLHVIVLYPVKIIVTPEIVLEILPIFTLIGQLTN